MTEKRNQQIHFKVTLEEKEALEKRAAERGIGKTAYIIEKTLQDTATCIYDTGFRQAVCQVCSLMPYVKQMGLDKDIEQEYVQGVNMLWQYLK